MAQLTKAQVIKIASAGYPDDLVNEAYKSRVVFDGLATFIACELRETLDSTGPAEAQLNEAIERMEQAQQELGGVIAKLYDKLYDFELQKERRSPKLRRNGPNGRTRQANRH